MNNLKSSKCIRKQKLQTGEAWMTDASYGKYCENWLEKLINRHWSEDEIKSIEKKKKHKENMNWNQILTKVQQTRVQMDRAKRTGKYVGVTSVLHTRKCWLSHLTWFPGKQQHGFGFQFSHLILALQYIHCEINGMGWNQQVESGLTERRTWRKTQEWRHHCRTDAADCMLGIFFQVVSCKTAALETMETQTEVWHLNASWRGMFYLWWNEASIHNCTELSLQPWWRDWYRQTTRREVKRICFRGSFQIRRDDFHS